jgi:transcription antitermination factor NusG
MAEACPNSTKHWFALMVKPLYEKAVATQLSARGIEGYTPLYQVRRRRSDRVKMVEIALFPWYVFCRFSFDERLCVLRTPGVNSIVGFGGKPSPLSEDEIAAVRLVTGSGLMVKPWDPVSIGQRVRVVRGPLAGLEGILAREKTNHRLIVNIEIINRAIAVEIDRDLVNLTSEVRG